MLIGSVEDKTEASTKIVVEGPQVEEEDNLIISLNSVVGITDSKTMKMIGRIGTGDLIVMMDPGTTNNFNSNTVVEKLGITCEECERYRVILGNEDEILGQRVCRRVTLHLQGLLIVQDFLPSELGNSDVIFRVQWLETLGPVTTNWKTQTMQFRWKGRLVLLVGDPSLKRSRISLK